MESEDRFETALHSTNPVDSPRDLVQELSAEGYGKSRIVALFEQQLIHLQENPAREAEADSVRDILDFLAGWCSPHMKLFPREDDVFPTVPPR